ncbi:MAG: hypothetical protein MJ153_05380 [Clostridia bacterium]|nr:hypothetical protein [Clostridia bacterium]
MKNSNKLKITYYVLLAVTIILNILYLATNFKNGTQPNWSQFIIPYAIIAIGLDDVTNTEKKAIATDSVENV